MASPLPLAFRACLISLAALSTLALSATGIDPDAEPPPPERGQIEADWVRQAAVRFGPTATAPITRAEDAAGGVDGTRNGQWGFHTEHEANPWWQVDLGEPTPIERVVLWNRCDGFASRNDRIQLLLSLDGHAFRQVYQHTGGTFLGQTDGQPLVIALDRPSARYLRLTLPTPSYLHLDEVEIFRPDTETNLALGKPATQSSVSQWSTRTSSVVNPLHDTIPQVIERGRNLAQSLKRLGVDVDRPIANLRALERELAQAQSSPDAAELGDLYRRTRWTIRTLALANPLLDFDTILFTKRAPTLFPHMSDQHYGWWSRPGGGIYLLEHFKTASPRVRCLTGTLPAGSFTGPDLSADGGRILFAYARHYPELAAERNKTDGTRVPEDAYYHLYEMGTDGTGLRRLTRGKYDDFDGRYLPDGSIAFLSTRKGTAIQSTQAITEATRLANLPMSFVRCGGDDWRPVPVFTLHLMDADGAQLRPLSAFENFEWAPSVAEDGRILYTRWDYIDRFNGDFFSLWSANQDGTIPQLVYGNYTAKPQVVVEARSIPRSTKLVFTASAHHSITGGSICLLDRERGTENEPPLTRLTPEVAFPETEGWPKHYYAHPWPLSEEHFLVGWADAPLPPHRFVNDASNPPNAMGLYLLDAFGNLELLYRDPEISSAFPMPLKPRAQPVVHAPVVDWSGPQTGEFLLQDVYQGLPGVRRGDVKRLRIVGVPPKVQPHMNQPELGVSREEPGKYVLGTVPVEADGSASFRLPSGVPVFFQALDERGLAIQTMRSLTYLMPGQSLACVGCHEHRDTAPPIGTPPLAFRRAPSKLSPGPEGSWPLRFDLLIQPVLDQHCVRCHQPGSRDPSAATLDLTSGPAWKNLLTFGDGDLGKLAFERDRSFPGEGTAANSKLWNLLAGDEPHYDVRLARESLDRFATWMDTYAQWAGHFSDEQARQLEAFRTLVADLMQR